MGLRCVSSLPHYTSAGTSAASAAAHIHSRSEEDLPDPAGPALLGLRDAMPAALGTAGMGAALPAVPGTPAVVLVPVAPGEAVSATGAGVMAPGVSARSLGVTIKPVTAMAALGLHGGLCRSVTSKTDAGWSGVP